MVEEEPQDIVRLENAQLYIPITFGIGGPVIGTGSIHRSEDGEVWLTGDLPHDMFGKRIMNVSIVSEEDDTDSISESVVDMVHVAADWETRREELSSRTRKSNTSEIIKELTDTVPVVRRFLEAGLPDGPHIFPKETP